MIINVSLILLFIIAIWALIRPKLWYHRQIKRWRQALALDKHLVVFDNLYANIDGFALSKAARKHQDTLEYVYGEIDFESFIALITLCQPKPDTVFYDLGSGAGKAVFACAMVFELSHAYGVELLPSLHACALTCQQRLTSLPAYHQKAAKITFIAGNFLDIKFNDASLLFINATTFIGQLWKQISRHLEHLSAGSIVISTTKPLDSKHFIIKKITLVKMSWGIVNAFIQERLDNKEA